MAREIKFRAWDDGYTPTPKLFIDKEHPGHVLDWALEFNKDIEQFAGLKDINGKEIYEGDVVKDNFTACDGKWIGEIYQIKFGQYDDSEIEWGSPGIGFYGVTKNGEEYSPVNMHDIEVIGNIHENPELLK